MPVFPVVNKARKPKFELHLKIYDLNNVPLVTGTSLVKWHLPHSMHGEHRGRTPKCLIANHRVEYNYGKVVSLRISIDKTNALSECMIEFEVTQEFSTAGAGGSSGGKDEKITLGKVAINLSEYVEESEAVLRDSSRRGSAVGHGIDSSTLRLKKTVSATSGASSTLASGEPPSPRSSQPDTFEDDSEVQDGVVRRYLMQDSKINSTLKIGILMIQIDGERNYSAPALKTAPVFGGIAAGFMAGEQAEQDDAGQLPSISKPRDVSELQDMYRRTLVASWASPPGELPADEAIEDIFAGGSGFQSVVPPTARGHGHTHSHSRPTSHHHSPSAAGGDGAESTSGSGSGSGRGRGGHDGHGHSSRRVRREDSGSASGDEDEANATLRPRDLRWYRHHARRRSGGSDKGGSTGTITMTPIEGAGRATRGTGISSTGGAGGPEHRLPMSPRMVTDRDREETLTPRPRAESTTSGTTLGSSDRGRDGFKRSREVQEAEVRDDMVAWSLPGAVS